MGRRIQTTQTGIVISKALLDASVVKIAPFFFDN